MSRAYVNFNGEIICSSQPCIRLNDRGLTLGHGLFETILIKNRCIPAWEYHWARLLESAPLLDIVLPFSGSELYVMIMDLITKNELNELASVRVTLTQGEAERGVIVDPLPEPTFFITALPYKKMLSPHYSAGLVDIRKNPFSLSSKIKSLSYLDNILAKKEARAKGYNEGILLNTEEYLADGAVSNIFIVNEKQVYTPRIEDGALPGVVRAMLLKEFRSEFNIQTASLTLNDLYHADEIFVTNALLGLQSVSHFNNRLMPSLYSQLIAQRLQEKMNYI